MPHEILTSASESRLTALIVRHRPWIERMARMMAHGDRFIRHELEHIALLAMWQLGWRKIEELPDDELRSELIGRMKNARRDERRARGGVRRVRVRGMNG